MNLSEFKQLFARRRICLIGDAEEVDWATQALEDMGFKSQSTDGHRWRRGWTFRGEIWATSSGLNWTFRRHYDVNPHFVDYIPIPELRNLLDGTKTTEEDIACPNLEDVL